LLGCASLRHHRGEAVYAAASIRESIVRLGVKVSQTETREDVREMRLRGKNQPVVMKMMIYLG
jgi:hypothetical protein